ncbi:sensor histidine kinase [Flavobacterium aquicola]|uniref:Histidine kinase n=1 Tax=Flavobacterium aquicola TaxID=1682742 RepID=A0A3E0ES75_9FLAO|nr:histidine kinase [Flavobacterium aquicola]REH00511.1 histidine kinase [Flavobacterium aquicola]
MTKPLQENFINENWAIQFLTSAKLRLYRHLFLIAFFGLALFNSDPEYTEPTETISRIVSMIMFLALVYGNMYVLVPKFLFGNQYKKYAIAVLVIIMVSVLIHRSNRYFYGAEVRLDTADDDINIFSFSFVLIVVILASSAIKLFQRWKLDIELISKLKQANANAELEQLKNQINPHFLFNTLNNANVLTKRDPDKASQVLMKLSDLLRYQLYDSAREKVFLTSDIHFLEDFLNLEKIRRDKFDFVISKEGDLNGVQVPPLLFISFVENAVKHNNDSEKASYVNLEFKVYNEELVFKCINSKPILKAVKTASGGLGLTNIKRRLELLFPASHLLKIEDSETTFSVTLSIKL